MQNNNNKDMKNIKGGSNNSSSHPCTYCAKPCFGLQCKECHLKMIENLSGECSDCKQSFRKKREDGTNRKRCLPCHKNYMGAYIGMCGCGQTFKKLLEDGRKFDKCFTCYQSSKNKCRKCDSYAFKDNNLCYECYHSPKKCTNCDKTTVRNNELCSDCYKKDKSSEDIFNCRKTNCTRNTSRENGYCRECFRDNRDVSMQYMISRCEHPSCSARYKGSFKFCEEHSIRV